MRVKSQPNTDCTDPLAAPPRDLSLVQMLVVDNNPQVRKACREVAEGMGLSVSEAKDLRLAANILSRRRTSLILLDVTGLENGGQESLKELRTLYPRLLVVVMSGCATISNAVETMKLGACDYLSKPFPLRVLTDALGRVANRWHFNAEARLLQGILGTASEMANSLGQSPEMEKLYRILSSVANSTHPVMILGENGTGKTLVAQAIHSSGRRSSQPFVSVDCKELAPEEINDVLFGQADGASSEVVAQNAGLLFSPEGGTVLLNEIETLSLEMQSKLARTLQAKEARSHNASHATGVTMRVLATACNDLEQMVREGFFRMDLYRLLSIVNLKIPPLRGRPDDIAFLAKRYLARIQDNTGVIRTLSPETLRMLETYDWPDNVRELEDTIVHAYLRSSGPDVNAGHLPQKLLNFHRPREVALKSPADDGSAMATAKEVVLPIAKIEERAIRKAIDQTDGNKLMAAKLLGIGKTTLYRKLKEYDLSDTTDSIASSASSPESRQKSDTNESATICA